MSSSFQIADSLILSASVFDRLSDVLQEFAQPSTDALILTETAMPSSSVVVQPGIHRFVVIVSPTFAGLMVARNASKPAIVISPLTQEKFYSVSLSFEPSTIAAFLSQLHQDLPAHNSIHPLLLQVMPSIQPNSALRQAQFSLRLAQVLSNKFSSHPNNSIPLTRPLNGVNQSEQGIVFGEMATQIRQTQELSLILQMAIQQVRTFLQVERVVIYEFETMLDAPHSNPSEVNCPKRVNILCGRVTYEDRIDASIPPLLNMTEGIQCFVGISEYQEKYRKGAIQAIADVRTRYAQTPCLVNLLEEAQVRSKLVVPIVFQDELWGLLIAHQCSTTRYWQESEIRFLQCVAELLSIAIYQNQLYHQLQLQAQTLENRVIARTQELHDAVDAAQSASLSKTEFLATVSHELRTPLTAIIGMSTTLLRLPMDDRRERLLPLEKQQDYLKIIRNSGEHLLELINDILDLSQVEAGRAVLDVKEFSLTQVVTECIRMLRDKAQQNQVKLVLDVQIESRSDVNGIINCSDRDQFTADPRRVKQILLNLLSNAIKFTPEGGRVTLRVWRQAETAIFQVEDTGIGIAEHQFPLLFRKFQQLDRTYQRQYEGTGLGLALTKQLVELHNGYIDVESTVQVGSTFTVHLPSQVLKTSTLAESSKPSNNPQPAIGCRVLLIENQETLANLICDLLTAAGHQVIWMVDGMTALHQIEIIKPEVILVDTQLTGMSLNEIISQLRENPITQSVRVLLLHHEDRFDDRSLTLDVEAYLKMPLACPEELLDKVNELANNPLSHPDL